jgi:hypothetical protein
VEDTTRAPLGIPRAEKWLSAQIVRRCCNPDTGLMATVPPSRDPERGARAGFLTSAARRGASVFKMRDVSRHKSMDVPQVYVRDARWRTPLRTLPW